MATPAALVVGLFVVRPEALGSPATKLALMTFAGCLLMMLGELAETLTKWAQARMQPRAVAAQTPSMMDVLKSAMAAAPESRRFG